MTPGTQLRVMWLVALSLAAPAAAVGAQTSSGGVAERPRFSAEVATGAAVGHQTSGAILNGEGEMRVARGVSIFLEAGRVGSVGTSDLDARAETIARAMGTAGSAAYELTYADAGIRVRVPFVSRVEPYLAGGLGAARVRTESEFSSNGAAVAPGTRGIQLGPDLDGSLTKLMVTAGAGAAIPLTTRVFGDLSARYGRVLSRASEIANDQAIDLLRLQAGIGIRF